MRIFLIPVIIIEFCKTYCAKLHAAQFIIHILLLNVQLSKAYYNVFIKVVIKM